MEAAPSPSVINLDECPSTNTWLAEHADGMPHGTIVSTHCQSAGRGQRGNSWEAAPGMNITMSMLLRPRHISAREQFYLSEISALAVVEMLDAYGIPDVSIKWPNDIYSGNRKICGMLIEHTITGKGIDATISGIGINVNQREFLSDAPNPVSMYQITAREEDISAMTRDLGQRILRLMDVFDRPEADLQMLHNRFLNRLWRRGIPAAYTDAETRITYTGTITDVEPTGMLHITDHHGNQRVYAFKEVIFNI